MASWMSPAASKLHAPPALLRRLPADLTLDDDVPALAPPARTRLAPRGRDDVETAAADSAVDTQEPDSDSSEETTAHPAAAPQARQRERTGVADPAPVRSRSSSRAPHRTHATWRRWRATRKLAPWTRASQGQQRKAASASQRTATAPPQSSQPLLRAFISIRDRRAKAEVQIWTFL
ncbi:hypothetical protein Cni_G02773 [Canna indica]|uniref:Uncharacterized protein n=1 Tax=Canna indica TaxID=4628 RepID=A0AAQ3JQ89_9LILI|nr:hypothetical protein Cni_G02773 [Canna indica]